MNFPWRLSVIFLIVLGLLACAAPVKKANVPIKIKSPDNVANGFVVPVAVALQTPLIAGQSLEVRSNGELALTVTVTRELSLDYFSSRIRMRKSGEIQVAVKANGATLHSEERSVQIGGYEEKIKDIGPNGTEYRKRIKDNKIMLMFANYMKESDYLKKVTLNTEQGQVNVELSTIVSAPPYVSVNLANPSANIDIEATLGSN